MDIAKKIVQLADTMDKQGFFVVADVLDRVLLKMADGKRPTETNRNSWRNGRIPDIKAYQCKECGKDAQRFYSYGKNDVYTALCNPCFEAFQKDNPPERFR